MDPLSSASQPNKPNNSRVRYRKALADQRNPLAELDEQQLAKATSDFLSSTSQYIQGNHLGVQYNNPIAGPGYSQINGPTYQPYGLQSQRLADAKLELLRAEREDSWGGTAASIATLVAFANLVLQHGTNIAKSYHGAHGEIKILLREIKSFSTALHHLSRLASKLEATQASSADVSPDKTRDLTPGYLHSAHRLLMELEKKLSITDADLKKGSTLQELTGQLGGLFSLLEIKEFIRRIQHHKQIINLALTADSPNKLNIYLSEQHETQINIENPRSTARGGPDGIQSNDSEVLLDNDPNVTINSDEDTAGASTDEEVDDEPYHQLRSIEGVILQSFAYETLHCRLNDFINPSLQSKLRDLAVAWSKPHHKYHAHIASYKLLNLVAELRYIDPHEIHIHDSEAAKPYLRNILDVCACNIHANVPKCEKFEDHEFAPRKKDSFPSITNQDYDYRPKPMDNIPAISEHEFRKRFYACQRPQPIMHWYHKCKTLGLHSDDVFERLPKKRTELEEGGDNRETFGQSMHKR
ncbi:Phosphorylase superfamily protein [Fusarium austroafricanum]|uniref:Phosphorylase superfamily protein n=1 Tax=Fusarium austroafricanum TaxID=2364996 RepID=A0A8H4KTA5_9HYPO|nr:Phosphorylase superfamily protein [Fusarium austroafricanum]